MEEDTGWFKEADVYVRSLLDGLVLLCGLAGCLVLGGPASADPVPLWSYPITTSDWSAYGTGGREAIYVNEQQVGMLDTERVIGPDGAVEYEAETGNTTITPPALAADGSGYALRGGGAAGVIDAIDTTGKVRWSYTVPAEDTVRALLAGNDGAAYVIVSNALDEEVLRLSPVDGSVTFGTPLPYGNYSDGNLFAEPSGVAAISGTRLTGLPRRPLRVKNQELCPSLPYPMAGSYTRSPTSRSVCSTPMAPLAGTPKTRLAMELCSPTAQTTSISRGSLATKAALTRLLTVMGSPSISWKRVTAKCGAACLWCLAKTRADFGSARASHWVLDCSTLWIACRLATARLVAMDSRSLKSKPLRSQVPPGRILRPQRQLSRQ
ncbi:MAG: hypothetical protein ABR992_08165 [Solirubrobacteraceae bacterium]